MKITRKNRVRGSLRDLQEGWEEEVSKGQKRVERKGTLNRPKISIVKLSQFHLLALPISCSYYIKAELALLQSIMSISQPGVNQF